MSGRGRGNSLKILKEFDNDVLYVRLHLCLCCSRLRLRHSVEIRRGRGLLYVRQCELRVNVMARPWRFSLKRACRKFFFRKTRRRVTLNEFLITSKSREWFWIRLIEGRTRFFIWLDFWRWKLRKKTRYQVYVEKKKWYKNCVTMSTNCLLKSLCLSFFE